MNHIFAAFVVLTSLNLSTSAWAQDSVPRNERSAPPARVGFQMALRTGYAIPMGKATDAANDDMSNSFSGQVPLFIEIGGKPIPNLFVGGYLGIGVGGAGSTLKTICDRAGATCTGIGVRLGAEIQYHILPSETANPWIGYGIGYESVGISFTSQGQTGSVNATGIEFAHLMGGVDFRVSRGFGVGPVIDFSVGEFSHLHSEVPGSPTQDRTIDNKATHEWIAFGVRGVFFP